MIKSVLLWTLAIIDAISKCDYKEHITSELKFSQNGGIFDIRLRQFPVLTKNIPHLYMIKFNKGLMYITSKKAKKEKAFATGDGGSFRSVEYVSALFRTRFAVST